MAGSSAPSHPKLHQLELPPHPEPRDLSGKPRLLGLARSSTHWPAPADVKGWEGRCPARGALGRQAGSTRVRLELESPWWTTRTRPHGRLSPFGISGECRVKLILTLILWQDCGVGPVAAAEACWWQGWPCPLRDWESSFGSPAKIKSYRCTTKMFGDECCPFHNLTLHQSCLWFDFLQSVCLNTLSPRSPKIPISHSLSFIRFIFSCLNLLHWLFLSFSFHRSPRLEGTVTIIWSHFLH